ncbi:MAG: hypothetical protein ACLQBL_36545 [Polyangiaceae bacterium]
MTEDRLAPLADRLEKIPDLLRAGDAHLHVAEADEDPLHVVVLRDVADGAHQSIEARAMNGHAEKASSFDLRNAFGEVHDGDLGPPSRRGRLRGRGCVRLRTTVARDGRACRQSERERRPAHARTAHYFEAPG